MCVTADYCLVPQAGIEQFTSALTNYMNKNFAPENAEPHACGIINDRHVARLQAMVDEARAAGTKVIQIGSDLKPGERAMPFYLVVNPSDDLQLMREEIFGPILAIKTYQTTEDAIAYVNKGDRPGRPVGPRYSRRPRLSGCYGRLGQRRPDRLKPSL